MLHDHDLSPRPLKPWEEPRGYAETRRRRPHEDLTHLVLLDGRLVDAWSEDVAGTRWEGLVPLPVKPPEPRPDHHEEMLGWLALVCGGWPALNGLTAERLVDDDASSTVALRYPERVVALDTVLDRVTQACFDSETGTAMRRAVRLLDAEEPELLAPPRSLEQLAGGVVWLVGKANGRFGPAPGITQQQVQRALGLSSALTSCGYLVQRALGGPGGYEGRSPMGRPDLLVVGRPELLLSKTRQVLVRLRDHAHGARALAKEV